MPMLKRLVMLTVLASLMAAGAAQPAWAGCTTDLGECFEQAAAEDSFWWRWAMGIDCELDYAECVRIKLIGA